MMPCMMILEVFLRSNSCRPKKENFCSHLEMYYKVFFLGETIEDDGE